MPQIPSDSDLWRKRKTLLVFLLVLSVYLLYYLIRYWHESVIDFAPLYVVGKIFLAGKEHWNAFYDFTIVEKRYSFFFQVGPGFHQFSKMSGFPIDQIPIPIYFYSPSFIPFLSLPALLPYAVVNKIVFILNAFAVVYSILILVNAVFPDKYRIGFFLLFSLLLLFTDPVDWVIKTGQMTVWMFLLSFMAWKRSEENREISAGILLGLAFWLKFFPALLILFWLKHRKIRSVLSFSLTIVLFFLFGFILLGKGVYQDYLRSLQVFSLGTPIFPVNQSFESVLMRWKLPIQASYSVDSFFVWRDVKILSMVAKGIILLATAFMLMRPSGETGRKLQAFILLNICGFFLTVAWNHYALFCLPLVFYLVYLCLFKVQGKNRRIMLTLLVFLFMMFQFLPVRIVEFLTNTAIRLTDKHAGAIFARVLLSRQLIGVVIFFIMGLVFFFKAGNSGSEESLESKPVIKPQIGF